MYLLIILQSSSSNCAGDSGAEADRGKSHPLVGLNFNAQASALHILQHGNRKVSTPLKK